MMYSVENIMTVTNSVEFFFIPFLFLIKSLIVGTRSKRLSNRLAEAD